ncbi:MAG: HAMP domain-containing histidine kinase [Anaerolineales bacterium]|nr:HAMP domain-containing histidine kinase [Anaerolineales bacterium]
MTDITPPLDLAQLREQHALFVRTAAHALRTPLQSLQGFAELLEPGLPPALAEHYISFIKREAAYLAGVVDDLALRHELAQGPLMLFPTVVEVGAFLHEAACTFEARLPDCLVAIEYAEDLPTVHADREHLLHIVFTLLRNAERCRPDRGDLGGLTVCAHHEPGARQVVFVVEDDGLRIPTEYSEAMFEPFARLPPALGRPRLGIGLGLFVARAVARQMGGDLYLASGGNCSGQFGNAFVLTMPVVERQVEP